MKRPTFAARARPRSGIRMLARILSGAALLVITACGGLPVVPPQPDIDRFDLVANVPVAGAQIAAQLVSGVELVSVVPLRDDVVVRSVSRGDRLYVAWIGLSAAAGPQVRVVLARTTPSADPPAFLQASAFASGDGEDLGASSLRWRAADGTDSGTAAESLGFEPIPADGPLHAWFADYPLGDLGRTGDVDVQDALQLLDLLRYGGWDAFDRYHGDLDGDGLLDGTDLEALLDKAVDPEAPAALHVKPREVSFAALSGADALPAVVLVGNRGRSPFADLGPEKWPSGVVVAVVRGLPGQTAAIESNLPSANRIGWRPGHLRVRDGAGGEAEVALGHVVALVAGQSNAVGWGQPITGWSDTPSTRVRMLGNDYRWGPASEPLDRADGQLDGVSEDLLAKYSFGTLLGTLLTDATGFATYLIPAAKGASRVTPNDAPDWLPGVPTDRDTLFGSAVFRARVSAGLEANPVSAQPLPSEGGPVNVVVWYQGESDATDATRRAGFVDGTRTVMNAFRTQLGAPVVYAQLASHEYVAQNVQQLWIAEQQRRLESGSGYDQAIGDHHLVVAFDLPRSDHIHLSAYGQRLLAERIDLAVREHVLGDAVDGTGPRLLRIDWNGTTRVTLRTTRVLRDAAVDRACFVVFDGPPNGATSPTDTPVGTNTIGVTSVVRDPSDPTAVRITLARSPTALARPHVVYMAPPGIAPTTANTVKRDLIRSAAGIGVEDLGLPLPAFGPLAPF